LPTGVTQKDFIGKCSSHSEAHLHTAVLS